MLSCFISINGKTCNMINNLRIFTFFEVNTKYISFNVLKISAISQVRSTRKIVDIFNTCEEIFLVFIEKKNN